MITLLQLVESMDKITPDSVDANLSYLWDQYVLSPKMPWQISV